LVALSLIIFTCEDIKKRISTAFYYVRLITMPYYLLTLDD